MTMIHPEIGYYTSPEQPYDQPTYDPPHDGPCLICRAPLEPKNIRTVALMWADRNPPVSVYYRVHRTCDEELTPKETEAYADSVLAMLRRGDNEFG